MYAVVRLYIHFTANPQKRKRLLNRYGGVVLRGMVGIFWGFLELRVIYRTIIVQIIDKKYQIVFIRYPLQLHTILNFKYTCKPLSFAWEKFLLFYFLAFQTIISYIR